MRSSSAANSARGTATSANWNTSRRAWRTSLGEVNKGIRRIVEYIKSHDIVPTHMDRELQELDQERQQLERSTEKADLEIAFRKKKVLDGDLMRQQLQQFEELVNVLPLEDQKELFSLLIKEVRVYPFESDDDASEALVAKVRGRLYKVEMSLHQLPGVRSLRSLNGKGSDSGKPGSAGRTRTYDPPVNSRLLYR